MTDKRPLSVAEIFDNLRRYWNEISFHERLDSFRADKARHDKAERAYKRRQQKASKSK